MTDASANTAPKFDNAGQYARDSILRYEWIFGSGYVSTGGPETTDRLCRILGESETLRPGVRVLDVGSGLGGAAFHLAEKYGAVVTGIDLADEMIAITRERADSEHTPDGVRFILGDVLDADLPLEGYEVVWSRDAFMHVPDKPRLYNRLRDLLAPGGHLVVTDYARRAGPASDDFETYVKNTRYHLIDRETYAKVLEDAGYRNVQVRDASDDFHDIMEREKNRMAETRERFLARFPSSDYDYLVSRWEMKQRFIKNGDFKWFIIHAVK